MLQNANTEITGKFACVASAATTSIIQGLTGSFSTIDTTGAMAPPRELSRWTRHLRYETARRISTTQWWAKSRNLR
jgi:hypothetical protein